MALGPPRLGARGQRHSRGGQRTPCPSVHLSIRERVVTSTHKGGRGCGRRQWCSPAVCLPWALPASCVTTLLPSGCDGDIPVCTCSPASTVVACLVSRDHCSVRPREGNAAGLSVDGGLPTSAGPPRPIPTPSWEHHLIISPSHCCPSSRLGLCERATCLGQCGVREGCWELLEGFPAEERSCRRKQWVLCLLIAWGDTWQLPEPRQLLCHHEGLRSLEQDAGVNLGP